MKVVATILGINGGFCTICTASAEEAHDLARISLGFDADRTIDKLWSVFEDHYEFDEDGVESIRKAPGDYGTRFGQTSRPLTTRDDATRILPPLHSKLCMLCFLKQLIYRYRQALFLDTCWLKLLQAIHNTSNN